MKLLQILLLLILLLFVVVEGTRPRGPREECTILPGTEFTKKTGGVNRVIDVSATRSGWSTYKDIFTHIGFTAEDVTSTNKENCPSSVLQGVKISQKEEESVLKYRYKFNCETGGDDFCGCIEEFSKIPNNPLVFHKEGGWKLTLTNENDEVHFKIEDDHAEVLTVSDVNEGHGCPGGRRRRLLQAVNSAS